MQPQRNETPSAAGGSRQPTLKTGALRRALRGIWSVLCDAGRGFYADDCPTLAAAISFYALLSLIPVLFLVIALLGYVLGSSQATFGAVLGSVREFIPHLSDDFTQSLEWVVANRGRLSWLGLTSLVIAAGLVFSATEFALDRLFKVDRRRSFIRSRLLSMFVLVAAGVVLLFSSYVGVVFHALNADPDMIPLGHQLILPLARGLRVQYLTSVALVLASLTVALRIFPHAPVGWGEAFIGGCVGTVLWEAARRFFLWYLANLAQFYVVYGSLGALVAVMVWIYLSATIFLYAAECIVAMRRNAR
jgi:membrane protein